jgi:glycerol-3-phosphate dehydrogenase (NAD(P)+)
VITAKGLERRTHRLVGEVVAELRPHARLAVLSGPSFAHDVARELPTAVVLAAARLDEARVLAAALATRALRIYASDDPRGVQIGGALKNVVAIACGIVIGRGLGESARAALLTRGLAEMARLSEALGGRRATMMGLSGLGDLALTCASPQSRNFALGQALGAGARLADLLDARRSVVEGVATAAAVSELAAERGIDMPIAAAVDAVLHRGADLDATIAGLMSRPLKEEA